MGSLLAKVVSDNKEELQQAGNPADGESPGGTKISNRFV